MAKNLCDHYIGLWSEGGCNGNVWQCLVTEEDAIERAQDDYDLYDIRMSVNDPNFAPDMTGDPEKEYLAGMRRFFDRRCRTDLVERFSFCPKCGKKISWRKMRNVWK